MATYDLLMIAILVGLTLYGYFKGMAWQVAYIASFVASAILANKFANQLMPQVTRFTGVEAPWSKFIAMAVIYAVASFGIWMLFRVVSKMIDSVKMEGFDHQMGAILGFGRGVLWCVGVTFLALTLVPLPTAQKQNIVNSKSGYYIAKLIDETDSLFPPEVHQVIGPYLNQLSDELNSGQGYQPGTAAPASPNGWPTSSSQAPAHPVNSGWPQSAPANNGPSGWPAPSAPASNGWPQASTPSSRQPAAPAGQFDWPDSGGSNTPATPAQPVTWPDWNRN